MDSDTIGRSLLILGALIAFVGAGILMVGRVPFLSRLPGDISIERDGLSLFSPVATCIVLSVVLTIALNVALRVFR